MLAANNLQFTSRRLKGFNARMKLRASMIAVSSVVSLRMSVRSFKSEKSLSRVVSSASSGSEKVEKRPSCLEVQKRPSFLDLPEDDEEEG